MKDIIALTLLVLFVVFFSRFIARNTCAKPLNDGKFHQSDLVIHKLNGKKGMIVSRKWIDWDGTGRNTWRYEVKFPVEKPKTTVLASASVLGGDMINEKMYTVLDMYEFELDSYSQQSKETK